MKRTAELSAEIIGHVSAILILRECGVTDYDKILDKVKPLIEEYDAELERLTRDIQRTLDRQVVCQCAAKSAIDCCCEGVDWRSEREKQLESLVAELAERFEQIASEARMYSDDAAIARARAFEQAAQMLRAVINGGAE